MKLMTGPALEEVNRFLCSCGSIKAEMQIMDTENEWEYERSKTGYSKDNCTVMFTTALFTIARLWKQSICPQIRKCDIYIQRNFIQTKEE
jgi:hypothetical protein